MEDISALGTKIWITADKTFPAGFAITKFPADADGLSVTEMQIANGEMGVNGDFITYRTAQGQQLQVSAIPGSDEDKNLQILLNRNRASKGQTSVQDVITMVISLPNNITYTCSNGIIMSGEIGYSITSQGKVRTHNYNFMFETIIY